MSESNEPPGHARWEDEPAPDETVNTILDRASRRIKRMILRRSQRVTQVDPASQKAPPKGEPPSS